MYILFITTKMASFKESIFNQLLCQQLQYYQQICSHRESQSQL